MDDSPKPRPPMRRAALPLLAFAALAMATLPNLDAREGPLPVDLPDRRRRLPPREPAPPELTPEQLEAARQRRITQLRAMDDENERRYQRRLKDEEEKRVSRAAYLAPFRAKQDAKEARRADREAKRVAGIARAKRRSQGLPGRTLDEARAELETCVRSECRDHAFGDAEIFWEKGGRTIAEGYSGIDAASVHFRDDRHAYGGDEARALRECGRLGLVERNDAGADEELRDGPPELYDAPDEDLEDYGDDLDDGSDA